MRGAVLVRDDIDAQTTPVRAMKAGSDALVISASGGTIRCYDLDLISFQRLGRCEVGNSATLLDEDGLVMRTLHHSFLPWASTSVGNRSYSPLIGAANGCLAIWHGNESSSWGQFTYTGGSICTHPIMLQSSELEELPALLFDPVDRAATIAQIRSTLDSGKIDDEDVAAAARSVEEAIAFLRRNNLPGRPRVMMSDDGVLTLQWRNDTVGAALIFAGDGTVSVAVKNAEKSYSTSLKDLPLDAAVPVEFVDTVEAIVG